MAHCVVHSDMIQEKRNQSQKQASMQEANLIKKNTTVQKRAAAQVAEREMEGMVHLNNPYHQGKPQEVLMWWL